MPIHVITMTTNETEYKDGLRMFEISFNRTRNIDTPMDMEVIQTTKEKFWDLGWKSKLLYVLKSLRCDQSLQKGVAHAGSFCVLARTPDTMQGV